MEYIQNTLLNLLQQTAFLNLSVGNLIMILVACIFLYLAIGKGFEPLLLVPISFGMLLVNIYPDIMLSILLTELEDFFTTSIYWTSGVFSRP